MQHVDKTLRTIPDRDHRGVAGVAMGGFMALWTAGKFPDLVASASSSNPFAEAPSGPPDFAADCGAGRRRLQLRRRAHAAAGARRSARCWPSTPARSPAPAQSPPLFNHADVYPNFVVWGWEAASNRRQPGFTVLENVCAKGFRSAVREWVPGGATLANVKLSITSAPRLYPPAAAQTVTYIRLRDGKVRRATQKADAQGRLSFELDGDAYEVGVSAEPLLAASGYEIAGRGLGDRGQARQSEGEVLEQGRRALRHDAVEVGEPHAGRSVRPADQPAVWPRAGRIGRSCPVTFTAAAGRTIVSIVAVEGTNRMPFDVPLFPPAEPATCFRSPTA